MSRRGEYKVVLLGEGRVGKTSLISRYTQDTFDEKEKSTTQAAMHCVKDVPVRGAGVGSSSNSNGKLISSGSGSVGATVRLAIWDTAGQERFHALAPLYYRSAAAAMLVYDICDADSLDRVRTWVQELRAVTGTAIRLVICGNKCDRPASEQEVTPADAVAVAAEFGAEHFFTSAKTGLRVAEAFEAVAAAVYEDHVGSGRDGSNGAGGSIGDAGAGASPDVRYSGPDRRRRRRGIAADGALFDGSADMFLDDGGLLRTSADYDGIPAPRPPRAREPLTLSDLADGDDCVGGGTAGGGRGSAGSEQGSGGGGGCC